MTSNQLQYWANKEVQRSNKAQEAETHRSNVARETETNRHNVVVEKETERHNRATELLTSADIAEKVRHNQATELLGQQQLAETHRANLAHESYQISSIQLGYDQLGETITHNRNSEATNLLLAGIQSQNNLAMQEISRFNARENARANMAREDEQHRTNVENERNQRELGLFNFGLNSRKAGEIERHNRAEESVNKRGQNFNLLGNIARSISGGVNQAIGSVARATIGG